MKRTIRLVMGVKECQHNFYAAQVSDSIDADTLELSTVSTGETTSLSENSPTIETSCHSSIVPDPLPRCDIPVYLPDPQMSPSSNSADHCLYLCCEIYEMLLITCHIT